MVRPASEWLRLYVHSISYGISAFMKRLSERSRLAKLEPPLAVGLFLSCTGCGPSQLTVRDTFHLCSIEITRGDDSVPFVVATNSGNLAMRRLLQASAKNCPAASMAARFIKGSPPKKCIVPMEPYKSKILSRTRTVSSEDISDFGAW